jgi:DNA invertase Pin-like site-specific DNA recombinase
MATVAYLRVSTDEQAQSGLGLEAQLAAIRKAVGEPTRVYQDEGLSGGTTKRPALLAALSSLRRGDTLIVARRDRLARDVAVACWIEAEVARHKARISSAAGEGTDSEEPMAVAMRQISDVFAQLERAKIKERTKGALAAKAARGEKLGGAEVPFGYRAVATDRLTKDGTTLMALVPEPDEQRAIALVRELRAEGLSLREIGTHLEQAGILTRTGKAWAAMTVKRLLDRRAA